MSGAMVALFIACSLVTGAGIYYSLLPAKDIQVDKWVMVATIIAIMSLRGRRPLMRLPLNMVMEPAYILALLALAIR